MHAALTVELRKLRRSRVVQIASLLQIVLVPLLAFLLVRAAGSGVGMLAGKGELLVAGEGWDAYLSALAQVSAAALFVGAGVVIAWVFGREHADRTFGALFALPTSRGDVARAKFVVYAAWAVLVSVGVLAIAVGLGTIGGVGAAGSSPSLAGLLRLWIVAASTMLLAAPIALAASAGRGYLPAIGAVVVVLAIAQISVFLGAGAWFPFSVPGVLAIADTAALPPPSMLQVLLAALTVVIGAWATIVWWNHAELT